MFLLALCLIGTAVAAPAIPEAPELTNLVMSSAGLQDESHMLMSPYIAMTFEDSPVRLRTLGVRIEPEPKEENAEEPEPNEELPESEQPQESMAEAPEGPKEELPETELPLGPPLTVPEAPTLEETKPVEPVVVKLEIPKPPSFISDWFSSFSLPSFSLSSLPSFITNLFPSTSDSPKILYPAYYTGFPAGAVIIEAPKP